MNIAIKIPDPLKRQVSSRRFGSHSRGPRNQTGRSGGKRDARDDRKEGFRKKKRFGGKGQSNYGLRSRW